MRETNTGRQAVGHSTSTISQRANRRPFSGNLIEPMEPRTLLSGGFYETVAPIPLAGVTRSELTPAGDVIYMDGWGTLHKLNSSGQEAWSRPIAFGVEVIATAPDGNIWLDGHSSVGQQNWIARYRSDGTLAFATEVVHGEYSIRSIDVNSSGQLIALGVSSGNATLGATGARLPEMYLMTLGTDGTILQLTGMSTNGLSRMYNTVVVGPDDSIVLTGARAYYTPDYGTVGLVRKLSPDGQLLWETELDDCGQRTSASMPAIDGYGNIYVAQSGPLQPDAYATTWITKISPSGSPIWSRSYGMFSDGFAVCGLVAGADGRFAAVISVHADPFSHSAPASPSLSFDESTVYYGQDLLCDADGNVLWTTLAYRGPSAIAGIDAQGNLLAFTNDDGRQSLIRSHSPVQNGLLTLGTGAGDQVVRLLDDAGVLYAAVTDLPVAPGHYPPANLFGVATSSVTGIDLSLGSGNDIAIIDADIPSTIRGGLGNDTIAGSSAADYIRGGQGNDVLDGRAGDDLIDGGDGNDLIRGRAGNDILFGDVGRDSVYGNTGDDVIILGGGLWQFGSGGPGADRIYVSDLQAVVMSIDEDDTVYGMRFPFIRT